MEINDALHAVCNYYNININDLLLFLNNNNISDSVKSNKIDNNKNNNNIILPYYGVIIESNCKGLIYNHSLYTQCNEKSNNLCLKCSKNKYGTVYDRKKYELGKYVTPHGKKEVDYNIIINRFNYNIQDVINEFEKYNIDINIFNINKENKHNKKGRGRPKKIPTNNNINDEIEVIRFLYKNIVYLKTDNDILLDIDTYDIVGKVISDVVELW